MKRFKMLMKWGKKYSGHIIFMCFLTMLCQVMYSYFAVIIQYCIKVLSHGNTYDVNLPKGVIDYLNSFDDKLKIIFTAALFLVILEVTRAVFLFIEAYFKGLITQNLTRDMRLKLYRHIGDLSYAYHNGVDTGDLLQRCTSDVETASCFLSEKTPEITYLITCMFVGIYQVGHINMTIMLVSIISMPISIIVSALFFVKSSRKFQKVEQAEAEMTTVIQENISSTRVVKAFANEKFEIDKFEKKNEEYSEESVRFGMMTANFWGGTDFILSLQFMAIIIVSIVMSKAGKVDSADIIACLWLVGMLIWPMRNLGRVIGEFGKTLVAVKRMDDVLKEPSEYRINGTLEPKILGNIEFKDVTFGFDNDHELLHKISFSIKAGETVAIVGKTGSGKTTVANLISRLLEYDKGDILLDGVCLKDIEKKYLRKNVGMVMQDPFLYSKTIYENITISNHQASREKVYDAARITTIDQDISQFDKGYETLVGEKGATMSGGQKQRVAIARVLVDEKPIIIFDDSLSAVDTKTDAMIREAIKENKKATMIIITHRTTTAKEADKIIVLDNGKINAIGTHDELANKEGLYHDLWAVQGRIEDEFMRLVEAGEFDE